MNESYTIEKIVSATIIACAVIIAALVITLVLLDQQTDTRIQQMIKDGTDPGKALCSIRSNSSYCPVLLK